MSSVVESIRETARKLLAEGTVEVVIGYEKGSLPLKATPCFVRTAQDVDKLIWDETCENNLAASSTNILFWVDCRRLNYWPRWLNRTGSSRNKAPFDASVSK